MSYPPQQHPKSTKRKLNRLEWAALIGMGLIFCLVASFLGWVIISNDALAPPPTIMALAPAETATSPPVATPTVTPTASQTPLPLPTPEPTATATQVVSASEVNKFTIRDIIAFVERHRDLSLPYPIPITFLTQQALRQQWDEDSFDQAALDAIETRASLYRALGLIEAQVDLRQAALDSQTDILLGYYSPEDKQMVVIAESVNMFAQEKLTFAHEYTHALQDYHFDLGRFLEGKPSGDALLAARAVPEGDASFVGSMFTQTEVTQDQLDYIQYRYSLADHPELAGVSPALGILTFFPYTAGEYFTAYLYIEAGYQWDLVNRAYQQPPISSEQVLHPEKYLAGEQPIPVSLPNLGQVLGSDWRELEQDVLGEIGLLAWLMDKVDEEEALDGVAGWDGDRYTLWTNNAGETVFVESTLWENDSEAFAFSQAFISYMNLRESRLARVDEGETAIWAYANGVTSVRQQGRQVTIIVAPNLDWRRRIAVLVE